MPRIDHGENPKTGLSGLESLKADKLAEINACFADAEQNGSLMSSLGFEVDADNTANRNVEGLIKVLTAKNMEQTLFCDHHNAMQVVTLEQLKTLQIEIIAYGQQLYAKKWQLREAVSTATTADEVRAVSWSGE